MAELIDPSRISRSKFHTVSAWRAALYVCGHINRMMQLAEQGMKFFDNLGEFTPHFKIDYDTCNISFIDGEGCWMWRVGDMRHERSGGIVMTKKLANEWLKDIRWINPNEYHRLRLS